MNRNFVLLWIGEAISLLGDQFYMIALPWLVLVLTGDPLAMGGVLATAAVPRAVFIVVGGAVTDRFSPRFVMLVSNLLRMTLVAILTFYVYSGSIELWLIYLLSFAFGLADAFFFPASAAIIPLLVPKAKLHSANAVVQGTAQLSLVAGPAAAGLLIAAFADPSAFPVDTPDGEAMPGLRGLALAFALDTVTFLASAIALLAIRMKGLADEDADEHTDMLSSIRWGLRVVWKNPVLRQLFILIAGINLFFMGPLMIGIPVLADARFPQGAAAFGILMSTFGGGALVGIILAGTLPKFPPNVLGIGLATLVLPLGIGLIALGYVETMKSAAMISFAMGLGYGYVNIVFATWLQQRTPVNKLGRIMSLVMLASLGLQPISMAISGAAARSNTTLLFVVSGSLLIAVVLWSNTSPHLRRMGLLESIELPEDTDDTEGDAP